MRQMKSNHFYFVLSLVNRCQKSVCFFYMFLCVIRAKAPLESGVSSSDVMDFICLSSTKGTETLVNPPAILQHRLQVQSNLMTVNSAGNHSRSRDNSHNPRYC